MNVIIVSRTSLLCVAKIGGIFEYLSRKTIKCLFLFSKGAILSMDIRGPNGILFFFWGNFVINFQIIIIDLWDLNNEISYGDM